MVASLTLFQLEPPIDLVVNLHSIKLIKLVEEYPERFIGFASVDPARTDVMDGCPKEKALLMLLRGMNPQVLAADEITAPADCAALQLAANCGVALLCSAHGAGMEDLERRPLYRDLLARKIFRRLVVIRRTGEGRAYRVSRLC